MLAGLLLVSVIVSANEYQKYITDGNQAYQQKKYQQSVISYQKVIAAGYESADLYYNLGNAYFKMDSIPSAILFYEKALKLQPGDNDILFNLRIANNKIVDKIDLIPELFYLRYWKEARSCFSRDQWAIASIIGLALFLVFAAFYLLSRKILIRKAAFWTGLLCILFLIFSVIFSWQSKQLLKNQSAAIVFQEAVMVKSSPDINSMDIFVVHSGTKVVVEDKLGDWFKVSIANGSVGWVEAVTLRMI